MTICIVALCDNATKVVMYSDRMITTDRYAIKFEHGNRKIKEIAKFCAATTAGDALSHEEVLDEGREFLKELKSPTTKDVVEAVKEGQGSARAREVEERILGAWPDISRLDGAHPPESIFEELAEDARGYDLGVEVLLGGVDGGGGRAFSS